MTLWVLVTSVFLLLRFIPGTPFDQETPLNPDVQAAFEKSWNLHSSLADQYFSYLRSLIFHFDMGLSMVRPDQSVFTVIATGFRQTLLLNLLTLLLIYVLTFIGVWMWARSRGTWLGIAIEQKWIALVSLPSLFIGPLLIYIFGFYFDILPIAFLTTPVHFILPMLALGLRPMAIFSRLLQRSISEQMSAEYVRSARARGLSENRILIRHIFRNSLNPLFSYSGPMIVSLLSGSFIVEMLFAIPGLGNEFISSLNERDYTVICGLALFYGFLLVILNLVLDLSMRAADPRLRETE